MANGGSNGNNNKITILISWNWKANGSGFIKTGGTITSSILQILQQVDLVLLNIQVRYSCNSCTWT